MGIPLLNKEFPLYISSIYTGEIPNLIYRGNSYLSMIIISTLFIHHFIYVTSRYAHNHLMIGTIIPIC